MNSNYSLEETILDTELRHINFFNGRLLTVGRLGTRAERATHPFKLSRDGVWAPALLPRPVVLGESYLSESLIDAGPPPFALRHVITGRDCLNRKPTIAP